MNKLYDLAVVPSDLGMNLIAAATQEEARALIGAGSGSGSGTVTSVNGQTGPDVVLTATDVGAVSRTATENIGGAKTFQNTATFSLGQIIPSNSRTVWRNTAGEHGSMRATDTGSMVVAGGAGGQIFLRPNGDMSTSGQINVLSTGAMTFSAEESVKAATRASLGALGRTGDEAVAGIKTFTGAQVRIQSSAPGFWLDESDNNFGIYFGLDANMLQFQVRPSGFTPSIVDIPMRMDLTNKWIGVVYNIRPLVDNSIDLGTAALRFKTYYGFNSAINTSDARLKRDLRKLSTAEIAAFTEVQDLDFVWKWLEDGDRLHSGPTVQAVRDVMLKHGLDPWAYSFMCYDKWEAKPAVMSYVDEEITRHPAVYDEDGATIEEAWDELVSEGYEVETSPATPAGDRYSFRKEELLLWLTAANHARLKRLEALI